VDLYVANDQSANHLWRNLGGMRFEEVGHAVGVAASGHGGYKAGMGVACGDLDGDGRLDLAVTNFYNEGTTFYHNLGRGIFSDRSDAFGLAAPSRYLLGFGIAFLDANNDGRLDLATANGHVDDFRPESPYAMPAQLLLGGEGGRLADMTDRAGPPWRVPRLGRALAAGDLDNDGRVDLLIAALDGPLAYFHNRTRGGNFVTFRLEGTGSNRDAVGARVAVTAAGRRQVAWRVGGAATSRRVTRGSTSASPRPTGSRRSRSAGPPAAWTASMACRPTRATSSGKVSRAPGPCPASSTAIRPYADRPEPRRGRTEPDRRRSPE
jgi:hypothetical protein